MKYRHTLGVILLIEQIIQYFQTSGDQYLRYLWEHLSLSLQALAIAILIGLPLGYISSKNAKIAELFTSMSQFLRIIPSLAILFIAIPIIGTGTVPALLALVILAVPSVIINTLLGFREIPAVLKEVALSMGMNRTELFVRIEYPLALPFILNGIKLALVEIIASATLATYIGAGGLGTLIFTGLGLYRLDLLVLGGGSVTILSLLSMFIFDWLIERVSTHYG